MPVPKRKRSRSRRDKRFANKNIEETAFVSCAQCKTPLIPHKACPSCGFYKGAKILSTKLDRGIKRKELRAKTATTSEQKAQQPIETEAQ